MKKGDKAWILWRDKLEERIVESVGKEKTVAWGTSFYTRTGELTRNGYAGQRLFGVCTKEQAEQLVTDWTAQRQSYTDLHSGIEARVLTALTAYLTPLLDWFNIVRTPKFHSTSHPDLLFACGTFGQFGVAYETPSRYEKGVLEWHLYTGEIPVTTLNLAETVGRIHQRSRSELWKRINDEVFLEVKELDRQISDEGCRLEALERQYRGVS